MDGHPRGVSPGTEPRLQAGSPSPTWSDGPKRAVDLGFCRHIDAERWVVETQAELNRGNVIDPRAGQITLAEYAAQWQAAQMHRPSTTEATESRLRRHVLPTFGHRPIGSLRPSEVRAWVKGLSGNLAPTTVEACYRLSAMILKGAVDDRLLSSSPCVRARLPDKFRGDVVPLTVEQVEAVRAEMPERLRAAVTLAAGVGLRRGEALGLSADRVDFLRRQLTFDRQLLKVAVAHRGPAADRVRRGDGSCVSAIPEAPGSRSPRRW